MEVFTKSAEETQKFGEELAIKLIKEKSFGDNKNKALIVCLFGDLGAGKTTFTQGFAKGLGLKERIISPTFILLRKYEDLKNESLEKEYTFFHVDLYRLEENVEKEVENLGLFDEFKNPENIILIEWAEKIKNLLPEGVIKIKFEEKNNENERRIEVIGI